MSVEGGCCNRLPLKTTRPPFASTLHPAKTDDGGHKLSNHTDDNLIIKLCYTLPHL
jgi:hypothetical protein